MMQIPPQADLCWGPTPNSQDHSWLSRNCKIFAPGPNPWMEEVRQYQTPKHQCINHTRAINEVSIDNNGIWRQYEIHTWSNYLYHTFQYDIKKKTRAWHAYLAVIRRPSSWKVSRNIWFSYSRSDILSTSVCSLWRTKSTYMNNILDLVLCRAKLHVSILHARLESRTSN